MFSTDHITYFSHQEIYNCIVPVQKGTVILKTSFTQKQHLYFKLCNTNLLHTLNIYF